MSRFLRPGFLCLWIPHFPVWCRLQSEPTLQQRAFVIVERGRVVAVSALALEAGVRCGWTTGRAQARCPEILLLPRDAARESLAWAEVQRVMYSLTPRLESLAPGLLLADVEPQSLLPLVRAWNIRAGFASDRASAHLAALTAPQSTLRRVAPGKEATFADQVLLATLDGVGAGKERITPQVVHRLSWFGWRSVGALRVLSRRQLEEQCGAPGRGLCRFVQGPRCRDNLRPVPAWTPPEEVAARLCFELPVHEPGEWQSALDELLRCVCAELGARHAQTLEVRVETSVAPLCARRVLKEPLNAPRALQGPALAALDEALRLLAPLPPAVLSLEVRLGALTSLAQPLCLFDDWPGDAATKSKKLRAALESVESRFAGAMGRYAPHQPHSPWPEEAWGWLPALQQVEQQRSDKSRNDKSCSDKSRGDRSRAKALSRQAVRVR